MRTSPRESRGHHLVTASAVTLERLSGMLVAAAATLAFVAPACGSSDDGAVAQEQADIALDASEDASSAEDAGPPPVQECTLTGPPEATAGDTLVWSDEFSGDAIQSKNWYVHEDSGERDTLLNSFSRKAVTVRDGSLFVTASATPEDPLRPYTSGRLDTFGRFARTYGKIEFRARFPDAPGVWYAIWARPQTQSFPELDFEILGKNTSEVWLVNHWAAPPLPADERRKYVTAKPIDVTQFHVYSLIWKPSVLEWRIDGAPYMQAPSVGVPTTPISWTVNGWVGGWGATSNPSVPATFEVDYFRVYRQDGLIADPTIRVINPRARYAQSDLGIDIEPSNFDEACFHVAAYEGPTLLEKLRPWPYRFRPSRLRVGKHTLTFVATDGVRRATTSIEVEIL